MNKKIIFVIALFLLIPFNVKATSLVDYITGLVSTDESVVADDPDHNPRYIGQNPNNYILFNNELWRIIGVFDGKVKIVRLDDLGAKYAWDSTDSSINNGNGINEWSQSKLMQELNGDYLNYNLTEDTLWYNGSNNKKEAIFDHNKVLSAAAQKYITAGVWYTGPDNSYNGTYYDNIKEPNAEFRYLSEKYSSDSKKCTSTRCNDTVERHNTWTGKVGLITYADYVYSTSGGNTYNREYCLTHTWSWNSDCNRNSWMYISTSHTNWTMTPNAQTSTNSYVISCISYPNEGYAINVFEVRPVVYLKTNTLLAGGTGTSDDPYTLDLAKVVTFDSDGGSSVMEGVVENGQKVTKPANPIKDDSTFLGWYTESGNLYNFDTPVSNDITLYAHWKFNYKIIDGIDQTFKNNKITIKCNGNLDNLVAVKINDKVVDEKNYTLESGSTILTFNENYLNTLDAGTYDITFVYPDGSATTTLTIPSTAKNPKTGDNIVFYISMLVLGIMGTIGIRVYMKKKSL